MKQNMIFWTCLPAIVLASLAWAEDAPCSCGGWREEEAAKQAAKAAAEGDAKPTQKASQTPNSLDLLLGADMSISPIAWPEDLKKL